MLTPKQQAFVDHYLLCNNASEAARRAGYSPKRADSIGHENLRKPEISAEIKRRSEEAANQRIADLVERRETLTEIMRDADEMTKDRLKALELLGKSFGDFTDKHEITGEDGAPIQQQLTVTYVTPDSHED